MRNLYFIISVVLLSINLSCAKTQSTDQPQPNLFIATDIQFGTLTEQEDKERELARTLGQLIRFEIYDNNILVQWHEETSNSNIREWSRKYVYEKQTDGSYIWWKGETPVILNLKKITGKIVELSLKGNVEKKGKK